MASEQIDESFEAYPIAIAYVEDKHLLGRSPLYPSWS
jgi:hypothetical protein